MRLQTLLKCAIDAFGADEIDIDYENGENVVYAMRNGTGLNIAKLDSEQWDEVSRELQRIKRPKTFSINQKDYRISVSPYESFGELQYVIKVDKIE
jgi:hypothetical protein